MKYRHVKEISVSVMYHKENFSFHIHKMGQMLLTGLLPYGVMKCIKWSKTCLVMYTYTTEIGDIVHATESNSSSSGGGDRGSLPFLLPLASMPPLHVTVTEAPDTVGVSEQFCLCTHCCLTSSTSVMKSEALLLGLPVSERSMLESSFPLENHRTSEARSHSSDMQDSEGGQALTASPVWRVLLRLGLLGCSWLGNSKKLAFVEKKRKEKSPLLS